MRNMHFSIVITDFNGTIYSFGQSSEFSARSAFNNCATYDKNAASVEPFDRGVLIESRINNKN